MHKVILTEGMTLREKLRIMITIITMVSKEEPVLILNLNSESMQDLECLGITITPK
jgi:hypothetical protein